MDTKHHARHSHTLGFKQALNYLEEKLFSVEGRMQVTNLRKDYDIPDEGYSTDNPHIEISDIEYPEAWQKGKNVREQRDLLNRLGIECGELLHLFGLHQPYYLPSPMLNYIFYGHFGKISFDGQFEVPLMNLCLLYDAKREHSDDDNMEKINNLFPIAIQISPYASERVIIDFIKKIYCDIEKLQSKYKDTSNRLGKSRVKDTVKHKRDVQIAESKSSIKLTRQRLRESFPTLEIPDDGHIGAIKHKIKKRTGH